jgi:hypothetical protein
MSDSADPKSPDFNALPDRPTKRTYKRPRLRGYGTLREITKMVGEAGRSDGGTGERNKTHGD